MTHLSNTQTREQWLVAACDHLLDEYLQPVVLNTFKRPNVRVSVGFPKGGRKIIAQCYVRAVSADKVNEMFVTPAIDDSLEILGTLVHELIHATDDCKSGHRGFFRKTALKVGLEGKMTATTSGEALKTRLATYLELVGPIPHAKLVTANIKKQSTRMIKIECGGCGFIARASRKWADTVEGASCPSCAADHLTVKG